MDYQMNELMSAVDIGDLRQAVGWNRMEACYSNPAMSSYFHIACYDGDKLIGYIDTVSNGVTDAYIQDLMVHPDYQSKGIGTNLLNLTIEYLKGKHIYMITVVFEDRLLSFYRRFGFEHMMSGQLQTYNMD
jgi:ribosomal protein S18 acetylase RimI-like enzyme